MIELNNFLKKNGYSNEINWRELGYKTYQEYKLDLTYLCKKLNIKITEEKDKRLSQTEFRNEIIRKYQTCIVSSLDSIECEAAHIVPVKDKGNYTLNNGLLLNRCIHKTFDLYYWSINPDTKKIEVNSRYYTSINEYKGKELNLDNELYSSLSQHYKLFLEKN